MGSREDVNWSGGDGYPNVPQDANNGSAGGRYQQYNRQNLPGSVSASTDVGPSRDDISPPENGNERISKEQDASSRDLALREKQDSSLQVPSKQKEKSSKICQKCGEPLTGQFVRALGGMFHLECFRCRDCGEIVASKFFPVDEEDGSGRQYPLCETDYFRRLDLLCHNCGGALRGSYVTALDRKYHIDHFTCSVCPAAFGAKDSYYEHDGKVYCHYHYSTRFAQRCNGCQTAILKQFVEIFRNGQNQHWHPECYMIHKFWSVRLSSSKDQPQEPQKSEEDAGDEERARVRDEEERMEQKTFSIWSILSAFEEASAACISDMLLHVSNGAYVDGVLVAKKFINHVELLFSALDQLDAYVVHNGMPSLAYGRESKLLCKRIVAFFTLLTKTQDTGVKRLGVTQELLSLVTGLAHYLKLLIRIGLQGALRFERDKKDVGALDGFLEDLSHLDAVAQAEVVLEDTASLKELASNSSDLCKYCQMPIDDECLKAESYRWHHKHLSCAHCGKELTMKGRQDPTPPSWDPDTGLAYCNEHRQHASNGQLVEIECVSRLQQYVYLLRIALARLLSLLRASGTLPHTSGTIDPSGRTGNPLLTTPDDPNLQQYDSSEGHRLMPTGVLEAPLLRADSRSKSYSGIGTRGIEEAPPSSFQQSVNEVMRQKSTRMAPRLSTQGPHHGMGSRIVEGPQGMGAAANGGQSGVARELVDPGQGAAGLGSALNFNENLTLDDIPRIVAAENAKNQRPNAAKYAGGDLLPRSAQPKRRSTGAFQALGDAGDKVIDRPKRYFSELSPMEYFIVRHIAVLQMQPLVEGHFNLEDLLGLIETRKQNFWNKIFAKNDKGKAGKKKGVFGVALDVLVETKGVDSTSGIGPSSLRVPALLDDSVSAMRQMDLSVEGVFRKNGNIKRIRETMEKIDGGENVDLGRESPVQLAALLKKFLRDMPDPLLTHKLFDLWIASQKIGDPKRPADMEKRRRILHLTCCLLPKAHRDSMEVLFAFLNFTASFSQVDEDTGSKMDSHNIATVIAPNILSPPGPKDIPAGMDQSFYAIEAIYNLLVYHDEMCEVPEDIQSMLTDSELFNNMPEVTTKEILKRYGDITKRADVQTAARQHAYSASTHAGTEDVGQGGGSAADRAAEGVAKRVDNNPQQANAWSKESSVRHVQGNGSVGLAGAASMQFAMPPSQSGSPAMQGSDLPYAANRPYHFRTGSGGSSRSQDHGGSHGPTGIHAR